MHMLFHKILSFPQWIYVPKYHAHGKNTVKLSNTIIKLIKWKITLDNNFGKAEKN